MAGVPAQDSIPTTVLTGFLGSGKTTLLRRALASPGLADTAVVINEVGEIAIDHYLVDFVEGDILELPGGCLCCAVREDLARTMRGLIDRRDAGTVRPFRRLVIETSGLADPAPILFTLGTDAMLDARLSLARVVTLVDATTGARSLERFAEAARQVALADAIVMSKTDLTPVSPGLEARLAALNPDAERIVGYAADDPGTVLFRRPRESGGLGATDHPAALGSRLRGNDDSGIAAAHTHGIDSFTVILGGPVGRLDFAKALGGLARERGSDLLRVKGLVAFDDAPGRPAVIQAAQHAMFAPEWRDDWPDADRRSRLVFIVHDIPRAEILAHFAFASPAVFGAPASRAHSGEAPAVHL
ncbi:MAG TPA: GTP-binding protein [Stellaceae bacterium]|nr:GTP-binding protein [Stellaceae bacterium]